MSKRLNFGIVFAVLLMLAGNASAELKAGAAMRVVTPDPLLPVSGGIGTPNPVTEKRGDLFARAMVFDDGDDRVAIVVVDFLGWPKVLGDRSRAKIKGIAPENVIIAATHTHSAPDPYGFPNEKGETGIDLEYIDWVCDKVADAVNEAVRELEPVSLKIAVDEAEGKIAYNYYAPQLYDPRCSVIQAIGKGDKVVGTLVNYAIHPEVLGNSVGILSPDLCGPLYDRIEEETGGMALFINGAQGGMITADNRIGDGPKDSRTWEECLRIGTLLADEALCIVSDAPVQENPTLDVFSRDVVFPLESELLRYLLEHSPYDYELAANGGVPTQLNLINLGTAQMVTIPGEALPNIGYYLKRHMPTEHTFLLGLANDALGYILTKEDFNSFKRYEYVSQTSLGEMTGEVLINKLLGFIEDSPAPDKIVSTDE